MHPPQFLIPNGGDVPRGIFAATIPLDHRESGEAIVEEPVPISDRLARAQTVRQMPVVPEDRHPSRSHPEMVWLCLKNLELN